MPEPRTEATLRAQIGQLVRFLKAWWADRSDDALAALAPGGSLMRFQPGRRDRGDARFCADVAAYVDKLSPHLAAEVPRALNRLPGPEQAALRALYQAQLSHREAGLRLGCSHKTVGHRADRALVQLARWLWTEAGEQQALEEAKHG